MFGPVVLHLLEAIVKREPAALAPILNRSWFSGGWAEEIVLHLLKKVQGRPGVVSQQVVKDQQQTGQVEGNGLQLRVPILCHFSDGLCDHGEDRPPPALR